jgi:hypothetical protein
VSAAARSEDSISWRAYRSIVVAICACPSRRRISSRFTSPSSAERRGAAAQVVKSHVRELRVLATYLESLLRKLPIDAGTVEALERHRDNQIFERQSRPVEG